MSFIPGSNPDFYDVAWDETVSPPLCVIVGELGTIFYSAGRQYSDGFQVYTLEQAENVIYSAFFDVAFGNGMFMAVGAGGTIATSENGTGWSLRQSGVSVPLLGVTHVSGNVWVAVGSEGTILRSTNNGINWTEISHSVGNLEAVTYHGGLVIGVGYNKVAYSSDNGLTWTGNQPGINEVLTDIVYGPDAFYIVGEGSTVLSTINGIVVTILSSPSVADFRAIAWSGGLLVAVGDDGATITSSTGEVWDAQNSGIEEADLLGVGYGDNRLVTVGRDALVAYSMTGAARPAFDLFRPISDKYRAQCFAQYGAYVVYGGCTWFEEGKWNYYPRRVMNAAPGSVDDFDSVGWYFTDLPGKGFVLDMTSIQGGILIAESDQLSLLTDAGSTQAPWMYHDDYGEGIIPISNLDSFNGVGFVVSDDGLIYQASTAGVGRLQGFFDLSQYEDWAASEEAVWLQFDPIYQVLFLFRQKSPWTVWLVNDSTGGVTEIELPEFELDGVTYEPRSAFIIEGLSDGIHASYAPTTGPSPEIVTVNLDLGGAITGLDEPIPGQVARHKGDVQTGSFRATVLGIRGEVKELLVRTWANPESTVRPDIAVLVKEETEDEWQTDTDQVGTIRVETGSVLGMETTWSRYIDKGKTAQEINVSVPGLEVVPFTVRIDHSSPLMYPEMGELEIEPFPVYIQRTQDDIKISVAELEIEPFPLEVLQAKAFFLTTPELEIEPFKVRISRGGWYTLPWLVDQCDIFVESLDGTRTAAIYTKTDDFEITLTTPLTEFESLYVNPGPARPYVRGKVGDYIFTSYGAHRITVITTAYEVELDWYPPEPTAGLYVPAQEIPEGGEKGDGKIVVGLGRGFDQLMLQVLIIPHGAVDATGAKITSLELGYLPTGPEMKTDAGGS